MDPVKTTHSKAKALSACDMFSGNESKEQTIRLFLTPQGIEFCQKHNFPTLEDIRYFRGKVAERNGVYIDAGPLKLHNAERIALIGNTEAELSYDDNTKRHIVVMMHGAKARITAKGYAVVFIYNASGCPVEVSTEDFAKVL